MRARFSVALAASWICRSWRRIRRVRAGGVCRCVHIIDPPSIRTCRSPIRSNYSGSVSGAMARARQTSTRRCALPVFPDGLAYESGNVGAVTVGSGGETDWVESVSPSFFGVIGVAPELGRLPAPGQSTDNVAVVSHALWQRLYAGRPVLGDASVTIDDRTYPIVGVLPPGMQREATEADVWLPVGAGAENARTDPVAFDADGTSNRPESPRRVHALSLATLASRLHRVVWRTGGSIRVRSLAARTRSRSAQSHPCRAPRGRDLRASHRVRQSCKPDPGPRPDTAA